MDAAVSGRGVALAPLLLLEEDLAKGRLITLWRDQSAEPGGYHLIHPETRKPNPARDAVAAWILSEAS
jgi:DNA-binding transcriptional LysR family regulator